MARTFRTSQHTLMHTFFATSVFTLLAIVAHGQRLGLSAPHQPPVSLLLWLPVHASEPDTNVRDAAHCLFRRLPSLSGQRFDVVVTLAGDEKTMGADGLLLARVASLEYIIKDNTRHLSPPPRVTVLLVTLSADAYDIDEGRGRRSSFAGPNELFYRSMIQDEGQPDRGLQGGIGKVNRPSASSDSFSTLVAGYAFVQVVETDCCATANGWLDALLQPMLDNPALLVSGSRGRGACWTGAEFGGCMPMFDAATPHAHLRDHINGNAMYRVGPDLTHLVTSARDTYGSTVPFDVALYLVSSGDRALDNGRSYSAMGFPVDEGRFTDAAYYGSDSNVAFVHAPRRLRAPAQQDILRRLDTLRPVTVVVVRPGIDLALLTHVHGSLVRARETRNSIFLVMDEDGYVAASQLAPMRVLMVSRASVRHQPSNQAQVTASILRSLAFLARAGLATFTIEMHDVVLQPYTKYLVALRAGHAKRVWVGTMAGASKKAASLSIWAMPSHHGDAGMPMPKPNAYLQPSLMFIPSSEEASNFLDSWAEQATHATPLLIPDLAARYHLSLATLPPDLFPPASSYVGPLWTKWARRNVAAVVSWDGQQSSPATPAALSAVDLWRSLSSLSTPFGCTNYSVLGTHPLPLTNLPTIHRSLATRAAFASFVREGSIACVVVPGFRLATTGNIVPDGVVVGKGGSALLSGGVVVAFSSLADLKAAGNGGEFVPFEYVQRTVVPSSSRQAKVATRPAACAVFGLFTGTSCFSARLASLIDVAIIALPPSYQCALDTRRTHREVALLSVEGRLGELGSLVRRRLDGRGRRLPVLLTGAWRHVAGGQLIMGNTHTASANIITLADLTASPAPLTDPISRLVRFGPAESTTSLASSPWADVIEYALCQGAQGVRDLADESTGVLSAPLTPSSALTRLAANIPPAVLAEDLTALARWLDRPDRPRLTAQRARLGLTDSPPIAADDFQDAILAPSLVLAQEAGARLATLPIHPLPWSALVGESALREAFVDHVALLPASVGLLLGPPADIRSSNSNTSQRPSLYPASIDLLRSSPHRGAVHALEHALGVAHGTARKSVTPPTLYMPADLSPMQHARLKHFAAGAQDIVFTF